MSINQSEASMNIERKNIEDTVQELSAEEVLQVAGAASHGGGDDEGDNELGWPVPPGRPKDKTA